VYVFSVLFFGIAVLTTVQFAIVIRQQGCKKLNISTYSLYGLLFFVGIERPLYLLLDPYRYRDLIGPVAENILFGVAIPALIGIYLLIILMWVKMYNATCYIKTLIYVVRIAWIAIAIVFIVEIAYDIVTGIFSVGFIRMISLSIYTVVLGLGILVIAILFLIYGRKMYHRLKSFNDIAKTNKHQMKKINWFAKITSISIIVLIGVLAFFLVLQFFFGENVYALMFSYTCQRLFEFGFSLLVIITHWRTVEKKTESAVETQQGSTLSRRQSSQSFDAPPSSNNDALHSSTEPVQQK
jgi:hypothetical protein